MPKHHETEGIEGLSIASEDPTQTWTSTVLQRKRNNFLLTLILHLLVETIPQIWCVLLASSLVLESKLKRKEVLSFVASHFLAQHYHCAARTAFDVVEANSPTNVWARACAEIENWKMLE